MNIGRQFVVVIVALLLAGVGCEKKKPQLPKQAKAPVETLPLPAEIAEAAPSEPAASDEAEAPAEEPKPQPPKRRRPRKPPPPATSTQGNAAVNPPVTGSQPSSTIATATPPPSPAEPHPDTAIAANVSSEQLTHQKQTTAQLIELTEKTLSGLSRGLSHDQEEMVAQIRSYVAQSKKASTEGDFERAYNLATKAHLLSDALVKQ